jgi:uncharacterized protein YeeX (DUF496 family)
VKRSILERFKTLLREKNIKNSDIGINRTIGDHSSRVFLPLMLANHLKLDISNLTTRQVLHSLYDTLEAFMSKLRKSAIRSQVPRRMCGTSL